MKRIRLFVFLAAAFGLLFSGPLMMSVANAAPQSKCPVMGFDTNKDLYADYKGKRVYFCCKDCLEHFNADPDKYIKEMQSKGIEPANTPK
jgi:YHS domain-containing protein